MVLDSASHSAKQEGRKGVLVVVFSFFVFSVEIVQPAHGGQSCVLEVSA